MPLYEYQCKNCHTRFERIQKFSDPPVHECPKCGGEAERLLSAPAVQFKGSGWYVTDYARKNSTPAKSSESTSKPDTSTPASTSSSAPSSSSGDKKS